MVFCSSIWCIMAETIDLRNYVGKFSIDTVYNYGDVVSRVDRCFRGDSIVEKECYYQCKVSGTKDVPHQRTENDWHHLSGLTQEKVLANNLKNILEQDYMEKVVF